MSIINTINQGGPLVVVIAVLLFALAVVATIATVYTAWLLAAYLVTDTLMRIFVTLGILGLASASAT